MALNNSRAYGSLLSALSGHRRYISRVMKVQPVFSLGLGLVFILILRRGLEYAPVAVTLIMFSMLIILLRLYRLSGADKPILAKTADFTVQFVLNNILLFILPFYIESITFFSRTVFFAPVIIGLFIITNWINLYKKLILAGPLFGTVYYAMVFFCSLNFIFPVIFGMRNIYSIALSGTISGALVLLMTVIPSSGPGTAKNITIKTAGVIAVIAGVWFGRSIIPPAPLMLKQSSACREIVNYRPEGPFVAAELPPGGKIFFFTSIFAPRGLNEGIIHSWHHNGSGLLDIDINEIQGGKKRGFATWSYHHFLEGTGTYTVEVWTRGGQLLGKKSFYVREAKADGEGVRTSGTAHEG